MSVNISYYCMKNMGCIISSHNKQVFQPNDRNFGCNCRIKQECPIENKYLTLNIIYEATFRNNFNDDQNRYLGASKTPFKERFRHHTRDLNRKYMKSLLSIQNIFEI